MLSISRFALSPRAPSCLFDDVLGPAHRCCGVLIDDLADNIVVVAVALLVAIALLILLVRLLIALLVPLLVLIVLVLGSGGNGEPADGRTGDQ